MADEKAEGLLAGFGKPKKAGPEVEEDVAEATDENASIEAMGAFVEAVKSGDKGAALEAWRTLQLAEG